MIKNELTQTGACKSNWKFKNLDRYQSSYPKFLSNFPLHTKMKKSRIKWNLSTTN